MARMLLALMCTMLCFSTWAELPASDPLVPRAGDRFYLHLDLIGALRQGDEFEIVDDRYSDISLKAKVVRIEGDAALIEVVSGHYLPPVAAVEEVTVAAGAGPQ